MTAQDIWARKYHELWEKLEPKKQKKRKDSFGTALWKWLVQTSVFPINIAAAAPMQDQAMQTVIYNNCRLGVTERALTQSFTQLQNV